jgi:hypothetical protein
VAAPPAHCCCRHHEQVILAVKQLSVVLNGSAVLTCMWLWLGHAAVALQHRHTALAHKEHSSEPVEHMTHQLHWGSLAALRSAVMPRMQRAVTSCGAAPTVMLLVHALDASAALATSISKNVQQTAPHVPNYQHWVRQ